MLTNIGEEEATIEGFLDNSHGSTTEVCFKGLVHWLEGNADRPVTWETLLKALRESELKGLADGLEEKLTRYVLRHHSHIIYVARTYTLTCVHVVDKSLLGLVHGKCTHCKD